MADAFTKILEEYWPQVTDEGINNIAQCFDQTSETFVSDSRNLLTAVEEMVRDDIAENGGSYKDFKRRADFEFRALSIVFGASLAISLDEVYKELPVKLSEGYHLWLTFHMMNDMLGIVRETEIYKNSEGSRTVVESMQSYVDSVRQTYLSVAKEEQESDLP